jgi:hypothetical protein
MSKVVESITDDLRTFIAQQHIFFVASAPLSAEGHVNISPKGMDTFRVLDSHRVAYLDLTGSGNETSAHLAENGRITVMFCAFVGAPNILRLFGQGSVHLPGSAAWAELAPQFPELPGARQIVTIAVERVQTSCGYAVPFFDFQSERQALVKWAEHKGAEGLDQYHQEKNMRSIDGLPTPLSHSQPV